MEFIFIGGKIETPKRFRDGERREAALAAMECLQQLIYWNYFR